MKRSLFVISIFAFAIGSHALTATAQPAAPAPPTRAKADRAAALYDDGKRHFDIGEYAAAIASWKESYLLSSEPLLLFNIGQAFRLSGNCAQANRFYLNYKRALARPSNKPELDAATAKCAGVPPATTDTDNRANPSQNAAAAEAERRVQAARQAEQEARRSAADARKAVEDARAQAAADAQARAEARRHEDEERRVAEARRSVQQPGSHDDPVYKKWWFWTAGVVIAAAAGGTIYHYTAPTTYGQPSGSLGGLDRR